MSRKSRSAEILERLAEAGGRRTAARQAIVEALVSRREHVTADDIARDVRRRFPSVNVSTVYRTLETLEDLGIIDHVHLGHGPAIYHLTDDDHYHMVCESCESVIALPRSKAAAFARAVERDYGFAIDQRHFALSGLCSDCR
jgi:Fur family transcriptional regulator, ferric uptake regulator